MAGHLGDRFQRIDVNGCLAVIKYLDDPTTDAAPMESDAHDGANLHPGREFLRNEVVEALIEPGDVRENPSDPSSHVVPIRPRQQP